MAQKETGRRLKVFALASFLNDFGSDMIYPIWPLFLEIILGANMTILGFVDGLGDSIVSISQAVSGHVADRVRRRKIFVWTGYMFGSASRIGYAFSSVWQHVIPFRILDRAGKMRGAPRDAMIADLSTNENRGRNFGLLRTMDNLGAVCGIAVCLIFLLFLGLSHYRNLFLVAAIPSLISALLILFLIKETKPSDIRLYRGISFRDLNWNFKLFLFSSALFALGSFSYSFLLVYASKLGTETAFLPVLYLTFTAIASISSLPFGKLSDKTGRKSMMFLSFILWGLTLLSLVYVQSFSGVLLSFVLYGLHKGALEPVQRAFVSELAPIEYRATSLGGFQLVVGLCALPSSLVAGLLWDRVSISTPFYVSLGLTILATALLVFVKEKRDKK
jgi:MFS family permease